MPRYAETETGIPAFGRRVDRLIFLTRNAESREKKRLIDLVDSLVMTRIQSGEEKIRETHASRNFYKSLATGLEFVDSYELKLGVAYQKRRESIERMQVNELFKLVEDLKNGKRALLNILKAIVQVKKT